MGLQDLNEELYKRGGAERASLGASPFDAQSASNPENTSRELFEQNSAWKDGQEPFMVRHKQAIHRGFMAAGAVVLLILAYFTFVKVQQSAFTSDKVTVKVDGPSEVSGSESSLFIFTYANKNRTDLSDVDLVLSYPENFRPDAMENMSVNGSSSQVHIGTVAGHSQGKVELRGKFYGSKGTLAYMKGVLKYKPESVGSFFQAESQMGIAIQSPSLRLSIDAPLEVASGNIVEYRVDYTNMSDVPFENLRVKAEYPDGFLLKEAAPKTSEGNTVWYIGNIAPGQTGSIRIIGTMDGVKNETKLLKMHIGMLQGNGELLSYSDSERLTKIVTSPLMVQQTVNGLNELSVAPGSTLKYAVKYRNDGDVGLRNVIITLEIQGSALDFSNLDLEGGAFDEAKKTITWKASDVRDLANLAPGKEGTVSVSVPVLESMPVKTDADKNFVITSIAKIDSPDIATPSGANKIIGSNTLRAKVRSRIGIQQSASYQDATFPNIGIDPPQVGKETTYTIRWTASNGTNDTDKATVTTYLPTGIRFTGKTSPSSESIVYDSRTNQITWNIGTLKNGAGTLSPDREVLFQVGITPASNQSNQSAALSGDVIFTAHDLFTDESLEVKGMPQSVIVSP